MKPTFHLTLDVTSDSEAVLEKWAKDFLTERGYHISQPNENWESPIEFQQRLSLCRNSFRPKLRKWLERGHKLPIRFGPRGTVRELCSNRAFDEFCTRNRV